MTIRFEKMIPLPMLEQDTSGSEVWEAESLLLEQGKPYVVEAPSGRGKTSLLSVIYGIRTDYQGLAPVEEEGDFFIINFQGNEIYSGIVNDVLVVTNALGYKDAVKSGTHGTPLTSSRFGDFTDGSLGMFINLDMEKYPAMLKGMLSQKPKAKNMVERFTGPFDYLGVSAGNYQSKVFVKTTSPSENSLYTIMKLVDAPK